ncbi:Sensory transduction histidine kinase [uncultured Alphaproteobacteria bacterium]|uniref:histidine kinase n=1 Tax=uncultured Alphaproteobacteria bacterium TaxID=91750 RepID=A0A212KCS9_9PROT|nr:Sensory transduction histidine kinase [uncultured Alphaproteobacteria bacterium]
MNRALSFIVFFVITLIGVGLSVSLRSAAVQREKTRLTAMLTEAVERTNERLATHITLLQATDAMFDATDNAINHVSLTRFVRRLETQSRYAGIHGIGFALLIRHGEETRAQTLIRRAYDVVADIGNRPEAPFAAPIVYLEPQNPRNLAALGHDLYSEPSARAAMTAALADGRPHASGPTTLPQEITRAKQPGFLIVLPVFGVRPPDAQAAAAMPAAGFVFAPFRAGDFFTATLWNGEPPLELRIYDRDAPDFVLYQTPGFAVAGTRVATQAVDVAGRTWVFEGAFASAAQPDFAPVAAMLVSLLVALALAVAINAKMRALAAVRQMHEISEQALVERDLMLGEMKHRIKNSIARILAIARQTAGVSDSLPAFTESFFARLQAMASAQDMLTRSHWMRADLRALLHKELQQVFGEDLALVRLSGPEVDLDERSAQAFGLIFHELATNALKHGRLTEPDGALAVEWQVERDGARGHLRLEWRETSDAEIKTPERTGFGTRLIQASIQGELGGRIERRFEAGGVVIVIDAPLA